MSAASRGGGDEMISAGYATTRVPRGYSTEEAAQAAAEWRELQRLRARLATALRAKRTHPTDLIARRRMREDLWVALGLAERVVVHGRCAHCYHVPSGGVCRCVHPPIRVLP